ncbi:MAG TPA: NnrU family protein [Aestuariivirga sp.]|nr:NnrU family protein [Aestuariivirga sp.]
MTILAAGVLLFVLLHGVAAVPRYKSHVKSRTGERWYGPVFGLASLFAIAVIVLGWRSSNFVMVYEPALWGWYVNYGLTFLGFLCLGIFLFRGSYRQRLRFPMGIATVFWAVGHLFANGDLASLILFGGLLLGSVAHIAVSLVNGIRPTPEVRIGHDGLSLIFGAAIYGIMTQLHPALIGVPIFAISKAG